MIAGAQEAGEEAIDFLARIMRDPGQPAALRVTAAATILPYTRPRLQAVAVEQKDSIGIPERLERIFRAEARVGSG